MTRSMTFLRLRNYPNLNFRNFARYQLCLVLLFGFIFFSVQSEALDGLVYKNPGTWDVSVTAGKLLPYDIVGVRDTYPGWGIAFSHPHFVSQMEYQFLVFKGNQVTYYNANASLRIDYQLYETLDGFFSVGFDGHYYQRKPNRTTSEFDFKYTSGFHTGFGFLWPLGPKLNLRADFRFGFGPGRNLYTGLGLQYTFDDIRGGGTNSAR